MNFTEHEFREISFKVILLKRKVKRLEQIINGEEAWELKSRK